MRIVVYNTRYKNELELEMDIDPMGDAEAQISRKLIDWFGYGARRASWSRWFWSTFPQQWVINEGDAQSFIKSIERRKAYVKEEFMEQNTWYRHWVGVNKQGKPRDEWRNSMGQFAKRPSGYARSYG